MNIVRQYDERAILDRVAQGDANAFEFLFNQYRNKVIYFAWKFLRSDARAEDVLQEVFLKVWTNREQLPDINNFKAWLNTLTRNYIYNALRRLATEEAFIKELSVKKVPPDQAPVLDDLSFDELQHALDAAVANLTSQQKKVFELSRIEGLKHEQIAEKMEISRDTVKKHMTDALRKIRLQMKAHEHMAQLSLLMLIIKL
jgi:RNA polymerase sigma-70 factor (family 1)